MSMSKKDYVAVAAALKSEADAQAKDAENYVGKAAVRAVAMELACVFAADNPRFDRAVFLAACGVA